MKGVNRYMGNKGFQKGHAVAKETREKISKANDGNFFAECDYCKIKYHTRRSAYNKRKHHFCSRECYAKYRSECMASEEQNAFGHGYSKEEREKRRKAREILNHYLRDKHLEKQPCEICGKKAEAHHDDYDKPLEVRWLCFEHHREWHRIFDNPELMHE